MSPYMCTLVCVCVCNQPPVCDVCMDYEEVVFQPWTVTPPHLGYVAIITNLSSPPARIDSTIFLDYFFLPPFYRPPSSTAVHSCISLLFSHFSAYSPGAKSHPPGYFLHLPPSSLRCSSLRPVSRACIYCCFL